MEKSQRRQYDELRHFYRAALQEKIGDVGLGRSKILVLEALLRLRQVACHPALVDAERGGDASVKLDVLLERLAELAGEGHKALVFSQFTKLLRLVAEHVPDDQGNHEGFEKIFKVVQQGKKPGKDNDVGCQVIQPEFKLLTHSIKPYLLITYKL